MSSISLKSSMAFATEWSNLVGTSCICMTHRTRIYCCCGNNSGSRWSFGCSCVGSCSWNSSSGCSGGCIGCGSSRRCCYFITVCSISFVTSYTGANNLPVFIIHTIGVHITFQAWIFGCSCGNFVSCSIIFWRCCFVKSCGIIDTFLI